MHEISQLAVGGGHRLAYSVSGAADGIPVVVLHGGPGSGSSLRHLEFFDLDRYRVIQFDQRGSGASTPAAALSGNCTGELLGDIERLRGHLGVRRWLVLGGSWGATLGALYAARCRDRVLGVLLRGLFVTGWRSQDWFMAGAAVERPAAWQALLAAVPEWRHPQRLLWLAHVFAHGDAATQTRVAMAWTAWERSLAGQAGLTPTEVSGAQVAAWCQRYRVHAHYLLHRCWSDAPRVARACRRLTGLPLAFLHGGRDAVCPASWAQRMQRRVVGSVWHRVADAGHDPFHPEMMDAMRDQLAGFAATGRFVPPAVCSADGVENAQPGGVHDLGDPAR